MIVESETWIMSKDRETKRTVRYMDDGPDAFGTVYVPKEVLGSPIPEKIALTIGPAE